ncbi:unnamed protein product [Lactuca saligna]|uniref:Uncharacterized protein n=1 Tax=Lactuca saligna TaxID=75948 RepID=A0AA36EC73_LACSI|nr:unnamed protein product [Lactuca saligna]
MAKNQQCDLYYHALVANGWVEEELEMVQEENPEARLKEYVVMDYENGKSNKKSDKGEDIKETTSEPHPSETRSDWHTVQESTTYHICSLEIEVANLKQQLFAAEARSARARQREDVITQEANKLAKILVFQFDI